MKRHVLIAAALVAGLGVYGYLRYANRTSSTPDSPEMVARVAAGAATTPALPAQTDNASGPPSLRKTFETTDDLFTLARMHANGTSPESKWLVARIVDYCGPFGSNPAGFVSNYEMLLPMMSETRRMAYKAAHERVLKRCQGFDNAQRKNTFAMNAHLALKTDAARAGSLSAEAALLSLNNPIKPDPAYISDLVKRVVASRDPEAYLAVSEAMGLGAAGQEAVYGKFSGSNAAMYAWQLAACRLGLDCSPEGALMTQYCSAGGICESEPNLESLIFKHLATRAEEADIRRMADDIVNSSGS